MSCVSCIRIFMIIFNFLFSIIGCLFVVAGLFFFYAEFSANGGELTNICVFLLIVAGIGLLTIILSILGCCGAFHYNRCILGSYFVLLLILFSGEIALGLSGLANKDGVKSAIDDILKASSDTARKSQGFSLMSLVEYTFKCCGYSGPNDYLGIIKSSCCPENSLTCEVSKFFKDGCSAKIDKIVDNMVIFFGVIVAVAVLQFLGLVFSLILCCAGKRNQDNQYYTPVYT